MFERKLFDRGKKFLLKKLYKEPNKADIESLVQSLKPWQTENKLIRLGGNHDGGYLLPDDLEDIEACFSPGVGTRSTFEKDCAGLGMKVFMADGSVEKPLLNDDKFNFTKKFIGQRTKGNFLSLQDWIDSSQIENNKDIILQVDIEGHEYDVFLSAPKEILERCRMIIVEFHMLTSIEFPYFFQRTRKVFDKLLNDHICVHIHPNNCCGSKNIQEIEIPEVAEFTFYRKDRFKQQMHIDKLPHILDHDNLNGSDSLKLANYWYK
jgi:hypothetical protein